MAKDRKVEGEVEVAYGKNINILDVITADKSEKHSQAKKALSEENPLAGGSFEDGTYYSTILPKDEDKTPWTKEASIIVRNAAQHNAKKSDILKAQRYFTDIGYMHESEIDGYKGPQLQGMIKRWGLNAGISVEAVKDAVSDFKLFD